MQRKIVTYFVRDFFQITFQTTYKGISTYMKHGIMIYTLNSKRIRLCSSFALTMFSLIKNTCLMFVIIIIL